jgi:hypothetical protein
MGLAPGPIPSPPRPTPAGAAERRRVRIPQTAAAGFVQQHTQAAQAAEASHRHPGGLHGGAGGARNRLGPQGDPHADGAPSHNLFGIKAGGRTGRARWPRSRPPSTSTASRAKVAKFRAYASYAESFADYARLMKDSPRYRRWAQAAARQRFRAGPAARRLRHRPGLCRQADARHQHHAAPAAQPGRERAGHERIAADVAGRRAHDGQLCRAADHRPQHRQRQRQGLLAPAGRAGHGRRASSPARASSARAWT